MMPNLSRIQCAVRQIYVETAFITPADHNYLLARLAFLRGIHQAGFFEAAQALEKYIKASLLLNGKDAQQGHNFGKLIEAHQIVWPQSLDYEIYGNDRPEGIAQIIRRKDSIADFIRRIALYGSTDNRYTRHGYQFDSLELIKLDQLLFFVRATCRIYSDNFDLKNWRLPGNLPIETWADHRDDQPSKDFFDGNGFWLSAVEGRGVSSSSQPILALQVSAVQSAMMALENEPEPSSKIDFLTWLVESVQFNTTDKARLRQEIAQLKTAPSP